MSVNFSPYGSSFIRVYLVCIYCFAHFKFISFWPTWRMQIGSAFLQHCVIIKLQIKCVHISWISFRGCRKLLVHFNFLFSICECAIGWLLSQQLFLKQNDQRSNFNGIFPFALSQIMCIIKRIHLECSNLFCKR